MSSRRKLIMVVEDEPEARATLVDLLRDQGHDTLEAATSEEALRLSADHEIDGFLLDINLEGMNGIELCRTLRRYDKHRLAPILFVTGAVESTALEDAFDAGCDDFISKPFEPVVLKARLNGHLRRIETQVQLERIRLRLRRYVSNRTQEAVESFVLTGNPVTPVEKDVAICFTDIRRFVALSEVLSPTELFRKVSEDLADQVSAVYRFGGYIDKFGGDGLMAIFDGEHRVIQSCLCALEILQSAMKRHGGAGEIGSLGIGIHAGTAVAGNIGSDEHLDYSVIGSAVNLAARLCGYADPMSIIVSKAVRDALGGEPRVLFTDERQVRVRGISEPVTVYTLLKA